MSFVVRLEEGDAHGAASRLDGDLVQWIHGAEGEAAEGMPRLVQRDQPSFDVGDRQAFPSPPEENPVARLLDMRPGDHRAQTPDRQDRGFVDQPVSGVWTGVRDIRLERHPA
jgi:hypothetical protein